MFFQIQVFPTEKKPDFVWLFLISKKSQRCSKKSQNFKFWLHKTQIGNPGSRRYGKRAFLFGHNVWPSCYSMSQYHSFVI